MYFRSKLDYLLRNIGINNKWNYNLYGTKSKLETKKNSYSIISSISLR